MYLHAWLRCAFLIIITNFGICSTVYSDVENSNSELVSIDIYGYSYDAVVSENTALKAKVSGVSSTSTAKHYTGYIQGFEDSWVRVSNIEGNWQGAVSIYGSLYFIENNTLSIGEAQPSTSGMTALPANQMEELMGTCGSGDDDHSMLSHMPIQSTSSSGPISPLAATFSDFCAEEVNGVCVIAEVEIAFDDQFQALFGALANAQATSIINIVDGHYVNDLKISIDTITVEMGTNIFDTTNDAGLLLDDIEAKKNAGMIPFLKNNNALTHLVTARNFNGSTLGVAYLGSVCRADGFSTGTSSLFFDGGVPNIPLSAIVVAHELAHNLGSDHDGAGVNVACPINTFIMSPGIGPGIANFSSCSVDSIEAVISGLVTPEQCMDFPTDVSINENSGNNGALNANLEFNSSHTVSLQNGFLSVDQLQISGVIDLAMGSFVNVSANGQVCTVAPNGSTYACTVVNPVSTTSLATTVRIVNGVSNVQFTQSVSEQTNDVQDITQSNNSILNSFSISNGNYSSNTASTIPNTPTTPTTPNAPNNISSDDAEEEGGGGAMDVQFLLLVMLIYIITYCRKTLPYNESRK